MAYLLVPNRRCWRSNPQKCLRNPADPLTLLPLSDFEKACLGQEAKGVGPQTMPINGDQFYWKEDNEFERNFPLETRMTKQNTKI